MEPSSNSVATTAAETAMPAPGIDIITPLVRALGSSEAVAQFLTLGGVLGVLGSIWTIFTVVGYVVAIILLGLYVYASVHKKLYEDLETQLVRDGERLYAEKYRGAPRNQRLDDVMQHASSDNPNDWKLAIIEADIILDDILKRRGYAGASLGERLKSISPQHLASIEDAWEAHKIRNRIAHEGADFVLTKRTVDETITRYRRVFAEFGEL